MQIAQTETLPIDEKIFSSGSLGYQKGCFVTNNKFFYKYRQQTSHIFNSRLAFLR